MRSTRKQPFSWQEKKVLRIIRKKYSGSMNAKLRNLYLTITEMDSDFNSQDIKFYTKSINTYSGLSTEWIPTGLKILENELNIIEIIEEREGGKFKAKTIKFTPDNIKELPHKTVTGKTFNGESVTGKNATLKDSSYLEDNSYLEDSSYLEDNKEELPPLGDNIQINRYKDNDINNFIIKAKHLGFKPAPRFSTLNVDPVKLIKLIDNLSAFSREEVLTAIETYISILEDPETYNLYNKYGSIVSFLTKGVELFSQPDVARSHYRIKGKESLKVNRAVDYQIKSKCVHCKKVFDKELYNCPECGKDRNHLPEICYYCGIKFERDDQDYCTGENSAGEKCGKPRAREMTVKVNRGG